MPATEPSVLDVLVMKGTVLDVWIAHGLQLDVAGQGETVDQALSELQFALAAACLARAGRESQYEPLGPAPEKYWSLFENGELLDVELPPPPQVESIQSVSIPPLGEARRVS